MDSRYVSARHTAHRQDSDQRCRSVSYKAGCVMTVWMHEDVCRWITLSKRYSLHISKAHRTDVVLDPGIPVSVVWSQSIRTVWIYEDDRRWIALLSDYCIRPVLRPWMPVSVV